MRDGEVQGEKGSTPKTRMGNGTVDFNLSPRIVLMIGLITFRQYVMGSEHNQVAVSINMNRLTPRGRMAKRDGEVQVEKGSTPVTRMSIDTVDINLLHHTAPVIGFVNICQHYMNPKRKAPLRRDTKWPLAAWMWRPHGMTPNLAKVLVVVTTSLGGLPMEHAVETIGDGNVNTAIADEMRTENAALSIRLRRGANSLIGCGEAAIAADAAQAIGR